MKLISMVVLLSTLMLSSTFLAADNGLSHASAEWQITAYSGAAPSFIGDFATIVGGDGDVLREGSNDWTCTATKPMRKLGREAPRYEFQT